VFYSTEKCSNKISCIHLYITFYFCSEKEHSLHLENARIALYTIYKQSNQKISIKPKGDSALTQVTAVVMEHDEKNVEEIVFEVEKLKGEQKVQGEESNQEPTVSHENEAVDLVEGTSENQSEGKRTDIEKEVPDYSIMKEAAEIPMNEGVYKSMWNVHTMNLNSRLDLSSHSMF